MRFSCDASVPSDSSSHIHQWHHLMISIILIESILGGSIAPFSRIPVLNLLKVEKVTTTISSGLPVAFLFVVRLSMMGLKKTIFRFLFVCGHYHEVALTDSVLHILLLEGKGVIFGILYYGHMWLHRW